MAQDLATEISRLQDLSFKELHEAWASRFRGSPPNCKGPNILRRFLAGRIQEESLGGLSPEARRKLQDLARAFERNPDHPLTPTLDLRSGTVLVREWKGVLYRVRVLDDGFECAGERYPSLSEVARKITGTRWSGPLFFGLKKQKETKVK